MSPIGSVSPASSATPDEPVSLPHLPGRPGDTSEIEGTFRVTRYGGLEVGRSGTHEVAEGVLTVRRAAHPEVVDTLNVHLAMNVASRRDPHGLPRELPLRVGEVIEVEGEYIPARKAHAHNAQGPAAVVHFTHTPGGFVVVGGVTYRVVSGV